MDTRTTNVLSICSGYGGIELGIEAALAGRTATVCYVENEIGVASILAARMEDGSLDPAPIWTDLRTFDPEPWRGKVDILAGGFPCQPHSVAGNKLGEDDPRELSGEVLRIAAGLGYPTLFLENVPGIMRFYYENIRPRLQGMGYTTQEGLFTAEETGAPHRRQRLFILAHAECVRSVQSESQGQSRCGEAILARSGSELAHTGVEGLEGIRPTWKAEYQERSEDVPLYPPGPDDYEGWTHLLDVLPQVEPTFCRDAYGPTPGVDGRLRATGNGVVPAVAALAFRTLSKALNQTLQSV